MEQQRLNKLFSAYIEDKLELDEEQELMNFIGRAPFTELPDAPIKKLWDESRNAAVSDDASEQRIQRVMQQVRIQKKKSFRLFPYTAAACLLVLIGFVYFFNGFRFGAENAQSKLHTLRTGFGERKTISLSDGTRITLSAGSSISYREDYNLTDRRVSLRGEGFFEVAGNPAKPFIVEHADLYTRVLGTAFNIRSFDGEENSGVSVARGRVEVGKKYAAGGDKKILADLVPGQQLIYSKSRGLVSVTMLDDPENIAAWKNDILILNGERFGDIAVKLERWYNVRIRFERENLKECRFKGRFKSLPVNALLDLLQRSGGFSYSIQDKYITIKGKGCL